MDIQVTKWELELIRECLASADAPKSMQHEIDRLLNKLPEPFA